MLKNPKNPLNELQEILREYLEEESRSKKISILSELLDEMKSIPSGWPGQMLFISELSKYIDLSLIDKFDMRKKESSSGGDPAMLTSR